MALKRHGMASQLALSDTLVVMDWAKSFSVVSGCRQEGS